MAFKDLNKTELAVVCEMFGVSPDGTKAEIIERLEDDGVTWEMYEPRPTDVDPLPVPEKEVEVVPVVVQSDVVVDEAKPIVEDEAPSVANDTEQSEKVLVKMLTNNIIYEIERVRFTRQHPFKLLPRERADRVLQSEDFREATPQEAQEYYS